MDAERKKKKDIQKWKEITPQSQKSQRWDEKKNIHLDDEEEGEGEKQHRKHEEEEERDVWKMTCVRKKV